MLHALQEHSIQASEVLEIHPVLYANQEHTIASMESQVALIVLLVFSSMRRESNFVIHAPLVLTQTKQDQLPVKNVRLVPTIQMLHQLV